MFLVICHGYRFGETLGLIINTPGTDRIDITPIGFGLGMNFRISIDFGGTGQEITSIFSQGETQGVVGT